VATRPHGVTTTPVPHATAVRTTTTLLSDDSSHDASMGEGLGATVHAGVEYRFSDEASAALRGVAGMQCRTASSMHRIAMHTLTDGSGLS
jgi:hypothetical protein